MNVLKTMLILFAVVGLLPMNSYCYDIKDLDYKIQTKQLPSWCNFVQRGNAWGGKKSKSYLNKFGNDWMAMHHYCWGTDKMNLALKKGKSKEIFTNQMQYAVKDFDYVLARVKHKNLMIMTLLQKAKAQSYAGDNIGAIQSYVSIIKTDKSRQSAYILLSNSYLRLNNREKAKEILIIGLKHNPGSGMLKKRLNEMN